MRLISKLTILWVLIMAALLLNSIRADAKTNPYMAIEIIGTVGKSIDHQPLLRIVKWENLPLSSIYSWSNHLVVYGKNLNINKLYIIIKKMYPTASIKVYKNPFYVFNKQQCCINSGSAKEWDNILLTANLVKDPRMQEEYLNYHVTQFKKWPEVANGFCNANFQQLLVFKNGRQLLLVISIPKGASFDKLNLLTTKNSPRVDDWNRLMAKYQEGITGTKPGEVWVFFKPVDLNKQ